MTKPFMDKEQHFASFVQGLTPSDRELWDSMRNIRAETCFRGRTFIVYEMAMRECKILDEIEVLDFVCDEANGASTELRSKVTGKVAVVGYKPTRLWDHNVFVWLPLYLRTRWNAAPGMKGSLGFDLSIRTQSRLHPRERGVHHMETGVAWSTEFEQKSAA